MNNWDIHVKVQRSNFALQIQISVYCISVIGSVQLSSRVFAGERGYNCTSDANLTCVETNCQQGLAVRCPAYQEVVTYYIAPASDSGSLAPASDSGSLAAVAVIAVLMVLLLALAVGWIVTCVVVWRKSHKQKQVI